MIIWSVQIRKSFVSSYTSSVLVPDEFICHDKTPIFDAMEEIRTHVKLLPGKNICVLQPCDVVLMKSLNAGLRHQYTDWASK